MHIIGKLRLWSTPLRQAGLCRCPIQDLIPGQKISALLDIREWQARNDVARVKDQDELIIRLDDLEKNQHKLLNVLST